MSTPAQAIARLAASASAMVALRAGGIREVQHSTPAHEYTGSTVYGVPRHARLAIVGMPSATNNLLDMHIFPDDTVFRRYVADTQLVKECLRTSVWPMRQYAYSPAGRSIYDDVRGTFFTTPDFLPQDVGVPESRLFVDFLLYAGTTLVHLGDVDCDRDKLSHWCLMFPYIDGVTQIPIRVSGVGAVSLPRRRL